MSEMSKVKLMIPQATEQGYIGCPVGGVFDYNYPNSKTRRARVIDDGKVVGTLARKSMEYYIIQPYERKDNN